MSNSVYTIYAEFESSLWADKFLDFLKARDSLVIGDIERLFCQLTTNLPRSDENGHEPADAKQHSVLKGFYLDRFVRESTHKISFSFFSGKYQFDQIIVRQLLDFETRFEQVKSLSLVYHDGNDSWHRYYYSEKELKSEALF